MRINSFLKTIFLLPLLVSAAQAIAQATITGVLIDDSSRAPLSGAAVTLTSDSTGDILSGAITDESGRFIFSEVSSGNYSITAVDTLFAPASVNMLVGTKNNYYDLGEILLAREELNIEESVVTGERIEAGNSLDSRIFNLSDNFAQSTGSMLDAMKTLPGVTVEQDGNITMRGSDRVLILIDGKQSALTGYGNQSGLDSIPASNIESIEVINNPSSRYDASGMAGIINIKFKQDADYGWTGDWGITTGIGALTKPKEDLPTELGSYSANPKISPSLNLNYNTDSVHYFLQSSVLVQEKLPNNEFTTRTYDDDRVILSQVPENREQVHYVLKTGADWALDSRNQFSAFAVYDLENHEDNAQVPFIDQETGDWNRYWYWREEEQTGFFNVTMNHTYLFDEPGHELTTNLQYTRGWEDEKYFLNEESDVRVGTDATFLDATENTLPLQVDYTKPLRTGRVELGGKIQKRWIPVTYDVERGTGSVIYEGLGDYSDWSEDLFALYGNYVREEAQFDIEAGLRAEQTSVKYEFSDENIYYPGNDDYDYFELFPNIRLTYHLSDHSGLAAYYNRRIDRPGEPELRIFAKYDDPELLKVGNPYLRPQFTTSYELAYEQRWDTGSLIFSAYLKDIEDHFLRVYSIDDSNPDYDIINKIYQNAGNATNKGLEVLFTQDVTDSWHLSGSINYYDIQIDAYQAQIYFPFERTLNIDASDDNTWDLKLNSQFDLPWEIEAQVSLIYYGDQNIEQGTQDARSSLDVGFKKPIWDQKGEVVFSFTDLFNNFGIVQRASGEGFTVLYENYYETQVASLGFKYNF